MLCGMLLDNTIINLNNIINKSLLAGGKFMPEMHLRQNRDLFMVRVDLLLNIKKELKNLKKQVIRVIFIKMNLIKLVFNTILLMQIINKDLINRTKADKVLRDKAYNIASNPEYDGYRRGLASMVYKFFDKKSMGSGIARSSSLKLADELHKPVIRKFNKRKVYSEFKENIWGVDLADTRLLSKQNKGIKYLLCVIDLISKYALVVPLKDKN